MLIVYAAYSLCVFIRTVVRVWSISPHGGVLSGQ